MKDFALTPPGSPDHRRWKGIQTAEGLILFLENNPDVMLYDTADPASRYVLRGGGPVTITTTVDGRSVVSLFSRDLLKRSRNGGYQLRPRA